MTATRSRGQPVPGTRGRASAATVRRAAQASATWPARARRSRRKPTPREGSGGETLVKAGAGPARSYYGHVSRAVLDCRFFSREEETALGSRPLIVVLAGIAVSTAAFGVLVPEARWPWFGALACFVAAVVLVSRAPRRRGALWVCAVWLAAVFLSRFVVPEFNRADSIAYFVYLRSAVFDGDLDFSDEYEA